MELKAAAAAAVHAEREKDVAARERAAAAGRATAAANAALQVLAVPCKASEIVHRHDARTTAFQFHLHSGHACGLHAADVWVVLC